MKPQKYLLAICAALLFGAASAFAQTSTGTTTGTTTGSTTGTTTGTTGDRGKANPHTPNDHASDVAKAVQTVLQQFDAKRDQLIAERQALLDKLQAAKTEADRKAILDELKTLRKDNQLGKEIRDEIKKLREQRKGGG